ncbi:MAG: hypothetical protein ACLP8S_31865 [Solirubrobacteraceae bacterium]
MTRLVALARFVWEFVVGDDWRIAAGVVIALAVTALLAGTGAAAWWVLPPVIVALLSWSVWRAAKPYR